MWVFEAPYKHTWRMDERGTNRETDKWVLHSFQREVMVVLIRVMAGGKSMI